MTAVEIGVGQTAVERIDAHVETGAGAQPARFAEESGGGRAGGGLGGERDRILEIDDQRVGAALQRLGELLVVVAGDEQQRAHGVRLRSPAGAGRRTHEGGAPAFGDQRSVLLEGAVAEFDEARRRGAISTARVASTSVVALTVSPSNSGAGKFTSVMPRLAIVVPTVVSLTEMPTSGRA